MTLTAPAPPASRAGRNGSTPSPVRVRSARSRRMPWLALAVVLVVGGGLLVGLLVQSAADRSTVLAAARSIAPGQVINDADLRVVDVGVDGDAGLVAATSRSSVVGKVAVVGIPEGALLAPGQVE